MQIPPLLHEQRFRGEKLSPGFECLVPPQTAYALYEFFWYDPWGAWGGTETPVEAGFMNTRPVLGYL